MTKIISPEVPGIITVGSRSPHQGNLPEEMAVTLTVNGESWLVFMCTPELLESLAVGFLFNEEIINQKDEIAQIRVCPAKDNVDIWTTRSFEKPQHWRRTSGCSGGITSDSMAHALEEHPKPFSIQKREHDIHLTPLQINGLIEQLFQAQNLHRKSGGLHASCLADEEGIFLSCEDIGRHNTLDKLSGRLLLEDIRKEPLILITTGRITSEMLQKAVRIGTPVIISCTTTTSLSATLGESWGVTIVGYARKNRYTVYTHPERIKS